jgi:hypothetical protein
MTEALVMEEVSLSASDDVHDCICFLSFLAGVFGASEHGAISNLNDLALKIIEILEAYGLDSENDEKAPDSVLELEKVSGATGVSTEIKTRNSKLKYAHNMFPFFTSPLEGLEDGERLLLHLIRFSMASDEHGHYFSALLSNDGKKLGIVIQPKTIMIDPPLTRACGDIVKHTPLIVRGFKKDQNDCCTLGVGVAEQSEVGKFCIILFWFMNKRAIGIKIFRSLESRFREILGAPIDFVEKRPAVMFNRLSFARNYFIRPHGTVRPGLHAYVTDSPPDEFYATLGSITLIVEPVVVDFFDRKNNEDINATEHGDSLDKNSSDTRARFLLLAGHVVESFDFLSVSGSSANALVLHRPMDSAPHKIIGNVDRSKVFFPGYSSQQKIDAAIVKVPDDVVCENRVYADAGRNPTAVDIFPPTHNRLEEGNPVSKFGYSGYAEGEIQTFRTTIDVILHRPTGPSLVHLSNVMFIKSNDNNIARKGDSGALITSETLEALGMVVAGRDDNVKWNRNGPDVSAPFAIAQPLAETFSALHIQMFRGRS